MRPSVVWVALALCVTIAVPLAAQTPSDSTFMVDRTLAEFWTRAARSGSNASQLAGHPSGAPSSFCISAPDGYPSARLESLRDEIADRTGLPAAECVPVRQQMTDTTRTTRGYFDVEGRPTNYVTLRGPAVPTNEAFGSFYVGVGVVADGLWGWGVDCGFERDADSGRWVVTTCGEWVS